MNDSHKVVLNNLHELCAVNSTMYNSTGGFAPMNPVLSYVQSNFIKNLDFLGDFKFKVKVVRLNTMFTGRLIDINKSINTTAFGVYVTNVDEYYTLLRNTVIPSRHHYSRYSVPKVYKSPNANDFIRYTNANFNRVHEYNIYASAIDGSLGKGPYLVNTLHGLDIGKVDTMGELPVSFTKMHYNGRGMFMDGHLSIPVSAYALMESGALPQLPEGVCVFDERERPIDLFTDSMEFIDKYVEVTSVITSVNYA